MLERVLVFTPCLADALWQDAVLATSQVLRHVGFEAVPVPGQTCCGQPAFNCGDHESARAVLKRAQTQCEGELDVVVPSASCAAMFRHGADLLGTDAGSTRWWELGEFLWEKCGVREWPAAGQPESVAFHPACHCRMLGGEACHVPLLSLVSGLHLEVIPDREQCCGFGGSFCASHPTVSQGIAAAKLRSVRATGASHVVSTDVGCLAHLEGVDRAQGGSLRFSHFAEVLARCL